MLIKNEMLQRFLLRTSVLYNKNTKITISFEVDMNKEWLDNIICTKKQKSEIIEWCQYIGFERYEKLY